MLMSLLNIVVMPTAFMLASHWGTSAVAASWIVLSPITILPLAVRLLRAIHMRYRDYIEVLAPSMMGSAVMVGALLALRPWLISSDIREVVKLALQVGVGGVVYAGFLLIFYRGRLSRYARFLMALRRGNSRLANSELGKIPDNSIP